MPKRGSIAPISEANEAVFLCIEEYWNEYGYAPSVRDIREQMGISSTSVVYHHLSRLETLGLIEREPYVARSIRILQPERTDHVPAAVPA